MRYFVVSESTSSTRIGCLIHTILLYIRSFREIHLSSQNIRYRTKFCSFHNLPSPLDAILKHGMHSHGYYPLARSSHRVFVTVTIFTACMIKDGQKFSWCALCSLSAMRTGHTYLLKNRTWTLDRHSPKYSIIPKM